MVELTPPTARKRQRVRRTKYDVRDEEDTRVALRLCQTKKEIGVGEAATILQSLKHDTTLVVMQAPKQEPKKGAKKRSTKRSTKGSKKGAKKGTTRASSSLSYPHKQISPCCMPWPRRPICSRMTQLQTPPGVDPEAGQD
eukprot:jgi/Picre1/31689/NNA_007040.t1